MMNDDMPVLVEVTRGPIVESKHRGVIVALEPDGRIVGQLGDATFLASTRSTIKPFQGVGRDRQGGVGQEPVLQEGARLAA